jgi:hypothetical protein
MTWKRVATAAVLIPFVVGLVLHGSTAVVAPLVSNCAGGTFDLE